jgi:hypothetical protein
MIGTPTLVPEPRTVRRKPRGASAIFGLGGNFLLPGLVGLEVTEAEFGDGVVEEALLLDAEIAAGLVLEQGEQIDCVAGHAEIRLFFLFALLMQPERHFGLHAEAQHEELKGRRGERDSIFAHHLLL